MNAFRHFLSVACALAIVGLVLVFSGGRIGSYFDLPSVIMVIGVPLSLLRAGWGFREMGAAFRNALSDRAARVELEDAAHFFQTARRYLLGSGLLAILLGTIAMLSNLGDLSKLGPNVAVALISIFYAVALGLLLCLPLEAAATRRLRALDSSLRPSGSAPVD
jgi:flagellar motor component MotA